MSLVELQDAVVSLPWVLKEQVVGYARSVSDALPSIFKDAGRTFDKNTADKIVFIAGIRKLHSIVTSSYWTIDNSGQLLRSFDVSAVRAGALDLSRGGQLHKRLEVLLGALNKILEKHGIKDYIDIDYPTLVKEVMGHGRSGN